MVRGLVTKRAGDSTYLNEMPYCATCSNPDFQTRVTSQALVACNLHERKAETALPPTIRIFISSMSAIARRSVTDACAPHPNPKKIQYNESVVEWRSGRNLAGRYDGREGVLQGKNSAPNPKNALSHM